MKAYDVDVRIADLIHQSRSIDGLQARSIDHEKTFSLRERQFYSQDTTYISTADVGVVIRADNHFVAQPAVLVADIADRLEAAYHAQHDNDFEPIRALLAELKQLAPQQ